MQLWYLYTQSFAIVKDLWQAIILGDPSFYTVLPIDWIDGNGIGTSNLENKLQSYFLGAHSKS